MSASILRAGELDPGEGMKELGNRKIWMGYRVWRMENGWSVFRKIQSSLEINRKSASAPVEEELPID